MDKSYYAIIPAIVRYDPNLTANAKLLYGEVTALANEKGYCWAKNSYFSELYGVSERSVREWIKQLADLCYIDVELIYKESSKEIKERRIHIGVENIFHRYGRKLPQGTEENFLDNNTYINNTNICASDLENFFNQLWQLYPIRKGKGSISKTQKQKLYHIGLEEMTRAIERYSKDNKDTDKQYWKHGSTFFNSGYVDYLDANYEDKPQEPPKVVGYHEKIRLMNGGGKCQ